MSNTITISFEVPEERYAEIMLLLAQNGIEAHDDIEIPIEVQQMVIERMRTTKQEDMIPLNDVIQRLKGKKAA